MRTFLGLVVLLFGLFAGAWSWYSGDTRPFEVAFWKQLVFGNGTVDTSTVGANVGGSADTGKSNKLKRDAGAQKKKKTDGATQKAAAVGSKSTAKPIVVAVAPVGSPVGRYVKAKAGSASGTKANTGKASGTIKRVGAPVGRYVMAKAGSNAGDANKSSTIGKIIAIGSPVGRYVAAPKVKVVKKNKTVALAKTARVSSPTGRYVSGPRIMAVKKVDTAKIVRVGSPSGRYIAAPKTQNAKAKSAGSGAAKIVPVGSPSGRYVSAKAAEPMSDRIIARLSSPAGRYVGSSKAAPTQSASVIPAGYSINTSAGWPATAVASDPSSPRKSASGALVFPITFEYRKSSFTSSGRDAADQLLNHIKAKNYSQVTLTGHTDERGSESVNLRVSRNRLNAVAEHLRSGGYSGKLNLIPKGESQPYDGVDRSTRSEEDLWELDRRVELASGS